jgi:hypothetical protein
VDLRLNLFQLFLPFGQIQNNSFNIHCYFPFSLNDENVHLRLSASICG